MIMKQRCPFCGSEDVAFSRPEYDWECADRCIILWDGKCGDCGEDFISSEVCTVESRLIAKDNDELEGLIERENKEHDWEE